MAFDAFMKIDGIAGESSGGTISIESFNWGVNAVNARDAGSGASVGKRGFTDLTITKLVDSTSPLLFSTAATGKILPSVQLTCRKAGEKQKDFLVITIKEILISTVQTSGNRHGGEFPIEEVSFSFQRIEINVGR